MTRALWAALVVLLLAGCGPSEVERRAVAALRDPGTRVVRFSELAYAPLAFPSRTAFDIDGASPVVEIPLWGRSYAKGFALPASAGEMRVIISSTYNGDGLFFAMLTVLDAEMRPLMTTEVNAARQWERWIGVPIQVEVPVLLAGDLRRQARYVVVHTTGAVELAEQEAFEPFQVTQRGPVIFFVPSVPPREPTAPKRPRRAAIGSVVIELAPPLI
ncbi:MAG: MalM family protein [Alphaproteobacteria bacterium]|nr:MalM family protein [Alphaproteobacteria bacterium]